jgi:hypothetical protein
MLIRDDFRKFINPTQPLVNVAPFARLERATGAVVWRCVCVYHLPPAQNGGQHVVFVDALNSVGEWAWADGLKVEWTWEGRQPGEAAPPKPFEKRPPEPRAQVDLYAGQVTSVRIKDVTGIPSDVVYGLRSDVEDVGGGNTRFHNSFVVLFMRTAGAVVQPPVEPPSGDLVAAYAEIARLKAIIASAQKALAV